MTRPLLERLVLPGAAGRRLAIDLRLGHARWPTRLALTLAVVPIVVVPVLLLLALAAGAGVRIDQAHSGLAFGAIAALWAALAMLIWWTQRRGGAIARTAILIVGTWGVAIALGVAVGRWSTRSDAGPFVAAAVMLLAAGFTLFLLASLPYRARRGPAPRDATGLVEIRCPGCAHAMNGLSGTTCPECGGSFTLDALIAGQRWCGGLPEREHDGADTRR